MLVIFSQVDGVTTYI